MMFVGSNNNEAFAHTQRVKSAGGTGTTLSVLEQIYGDMSFKSRLKCAYVPRVFGYKLNSSTVSDVYSNRFGSLTDFTQATSANQPVLMSYSGTRYFYAGVETCKATWSAGINSRNILEVVSKIKVTNAALGTSICTGLNVLSALGLSKTATNTYMISWSFGGNNYSLSGVSLPDNSVKYFKCSTASYGSSLVLSVSDDGSSWTVLDTRAFGAWASFTIDEVRIGNASVGVQYQNTAGILGNEYYGGWVTVLSSGVQTNIDFASYSVTNTKQFVTGGGSLTFNISAKSGAFCQSQVVCDTVESFDGSTDKFQSGTFSTATGKCTMYLLMDWAAIQSGTRYVINDVADNIRVYSDGTNIYVGDSANVFSAGAKPIGRSLLTFVKDGASSFAQFNQNTGVTGNAGTLMPTSITMAGKYADNTANASLIGAQMLLVDGADDATQKAYMQTLINSWQSNPFL